jgi:ubiquinone/menaquinone biosynthesis C-methylase UbiE
MTQKSISFDHAADVYDATRALPEGVEAPLADAIVAELRAAGAERVLEVGVGTGRIARPLAERGVRVCGIDIAPRMLARLREQLGPRHTAPDLLLGDATQLPLASASFRAVVLCHILHLVEGWKEAVAEIRRVLAPGGVVIHFCERFLLEERVDAGFDKWDELFAARGFKRRQRPWRKEMSAALQALGGACRTREVARRHDERTLTWLMAETRGRVGSWTWEIPEEIFPECCDEWERWARDRFGEDLSDVTVYELDVWSFA